MLGNLKHLGKSVKILTTKIQIVVAEVLRSLSIDCKEGIVPDCGSLRVMKFAHISGDLRFNREFRMGKPIRWK